MYLSETGQVSVNCYWHMGVDYGVIGFDMEVQPLATHSAA